MSAHLLLVSDIDDTISGDPEILARFCAWLGTGDGGAYEPRGGGRLTLAYASGRSVDSVAASIAEGLPVPCAVLGSVGTDARTWPERRVVPGWGERLASVAFRRDALIEVLSNHPRARLQPPAEQAPHKVSAYLYDADEGELRALQAQLEATGSEVSLIYSSARDLDVVPRGIDKGAAALHLAAHLGFGRARLVVAGDSGNDLALFRAAERGIVVANARDDLAAQVDPGRSYLATLPRAAGVQQGLRRWLGEEGLADTPQRYARSR